jgi:hypothetical protein
MKFFLISLLLSVVALSPVWATDTAEDLHIKEEGQFFVVSVFPGKKETQFFIAGNKVAQVNIDKLHITGSYFENGEEKSFKIYRTKGHFATNAPLADKEINLEIKDDSQKMDRLKVKLKKH